MNQIFGAVLIEGIRIAGQFLHNRPITKESSFHLQAPAAPHKIYYLEEEEQEIEEIKPSPLRQSLVTTGTASEIDPERATSIPTGCVPCAIGHLGTCSGLLNEAMRFTKDGMTSEEVVDRVGMCMDELNTMERVDLRPEMVVHLPEWEKELVNQVLLASRNTRHTLEAMTSVESLEKAAALTQETRTGIWRDYVKHKAANLTPEEVATVQERLLAKIAELTSDEEEDE